VKNAAGRDSSDRVRSRPDITIIEMICQLAASRALRSNQRGHGRIHVHNRLERLKSSHLKREGTRVYGALDDSQARVSEGRRKSESPTRRRFFNWTISKTTGAASMRDQRALNSNDWHYLSATRTWSTFGNQPIAMVSSWAWWAFFHLGSVIGPCRIFTIQSHAVNPTVLRLG